MPAGAKILPLRSNVPKLSDFVFFYVDQTFAERAREAKSSAVIGGENYGQGSSREHAAQAKKNQGLQIELAKTFARIHKTNLVNFGILPLTFLQESDYDRLHQGDDLELPEIRKSLAAGSNIVVKNLTQGFEFEAVYDLSDRQIKILLAGGLLNYTKQQSS
jgi:aconitate hydratase